LWTVVHAGQIAENFAVIRPKPFSQRMKKSLKQLDFLHGAIASSGIECAKLAEPDFMISEITLKPGMTHTNATGSQGIQLVSGLTAAQNSASNLAALFRSSR
jgi:hypothetical protein